MPYKDPQKKKENARKYAVANPEKLRAARHRNYLKNKVEVCRKTLAYYYKNKEKISQRNLFYHIQKKYGINKEKFIALLNSQNGKCKICEVNLRLSGKIGGDKFNIDHDHTCCAANKSCGKCIRGILCGSCNMGLGSMKDNSNLLRLAANYLDSYKNIRT
jgi:hypothetical protein